MAKRTPQLAWIKHSTANVVAILVIGYLVLGSVKLIIENYRIRNDTARITSQISELQRQNDQLRNLEAYYQTDSYKEKEARVRLGYQKPGEKVVIVPPPSSDDSSDLTKPGIEPRQPAPPSNPEQWWRYFFAKRDA